MGADEKNGVIDLSPIRARAERARLGYPGALTELQAKCDRDIPALLAEVERLREEKEQLLSEFPGWELALNNFIAGESSSDKMKASLVAAAFVKEHVDSQTKYLIDESEMAQREIDKLRAELAAAKRQGAAEELRRMADEWPAGRVSRSYLLWKLRSRADELDGKNG